MDDIGLEYLSISQEIKRLEEKKKQLAEQIKPGHTVVHEGTRYEWAPYTRTSTSWKGCYEKAYSLLDDEGQVISGEFVDSTTTTKTHYKFEKG